MPPVLPPERYLVLPRFGCLSSGLPVNGRQLSSPPVCRRDERANGNEEETYATRRQHLGSPLPQIACPEIRLGGICMTRCA